MGQQGKGGGRGGWPAAACPRGALLLAALGGATLLLLSMHGPGLLLPDREPAPRPAPRRPRPSTADRPFTIDNEGCTIPNLNPYDRKINKFISFPAVAPCPDSNFTFLANNDTHIWIQKDELPVDPGNVTCCYKAFIRPPSIANITALRVDDRVEYKPCVYFSEYIEVKHEFIKVMCTIEKGWKHYQQYFLFAPKKDFVKRVFLEDVVLPKEPGYNVIIMGLDAISRLNFYRTMPKTIAYIKSKGAIELMGYNKVGDNTFPNLTPLLMGIKESELRMTCWPHALATFDNCPFVWEWFKDVGYYTALAEDNSKLGTFNFARRGFIDTPTDYYTHTFMNEAEKHAGNNKDYNCYLCMGNKYFYQVLLDYIEKLARTLQSSKLFGFFWEVSMSHDFLNYPMVMDNSYEVFLKNLDSFQYLNNTIIIFLSDHGIRWGGIRLTKQGRLEERLPLAFILLPPSFQERYSLAYDNLKINRKRLTTPFDLHATLADLVDMNEIKDENIKLRSKAAYGHQRSISLFLPIPGNRTCKMAAIDDHWCTCHKSSKRPTDGEDASEAALQLLRHLNWLTRKHPQCARLRLTEVVEATELAAGAGGAGGAGEEGWRELVVVLRAEPGGGLFEGTLRREDGAWQPAGTVSRLNLYGDQSRCIYNYQLKLYCYCQ